MVAAAAEGITLGTRQATAPPPRPPAAASGAGAEAKQAKKLLYYRNPMGLPDTSPVPKKDSMGMDYIAVYEGEEPAASGSRAEDLHGSGPEARRAHASRRDAHPRPGR